jgi:inner membrane protein
LPDIDVLCKRFGIEYNDMLGHRGFTHSFFFAAMLSGLLIFLCFRKPLPGVSRTSLFILFFLATASHGILDAMVHGDLGVAFFAPFSNHRYFLPWRPVVSSPVGYCFFITARLNVFTNEFVWLWIPSLVILLAPWLKKRIGSKGADIIQRPESLDFLTAELPQTGKANFLPEESVS